MHYSAVLASLRSVQNYQLCRHMPLILATGGNPIVWDYLLTHKIQLLSLLDNISSSVL
jgi:hypothetical protein